MRCKVCDYALWNLPARVCPECGTAFKPSDFDFTPNAVRFCCPQCQQEYFGTSMRGHLEPEEFDCVTCGRHLHMDEMVLLPRADLSEAQTRTFSNPWADAEGGWIGAWWKTLSQSIGSPTTLMRVTPPSSSAGRAVLYVAVCSVVFHFIGHIMPCALPSMMMGGAGPAGWASMIGQQLAWWLGVVAFEMVFLMGWAASAHGILRAGGPLPHGFGRTLQAMSYSAGWLFLVAVPCLGGILSLGAIIAWSVCAIAMVMEAQQVTGGRASLAVLALPAALVAAGLIGLIILFVVIFQRL